MRGARGRLADSARACAVNLRSPDLRRAQSAFGLMWAGDWAATVAVSVIAFDHGGATAVGLVGAVRMAPAALLAPFAATFADRGRRERVLAWVGAVRALALGGAAAVVATGGAVALVYAALVAATIAQTLFRPAHSALLPTLCGTPAELTAANVVRGLLDSLATLIGPLCAALLLKVSGSAAVLIAAALASAVAGGLAASLRYESPPQLGGVPRRSARDALAGVRAIAQDRALRLLTVLGVAQTFTRGGLTVLTVVVAIKLLGTGSAGVGILAAAVGAGAVLGSLSAALLIGRGGLARWFGIGVGLWGLPIAGVAVMAHAAWALLMLALVGVGNAFVDVGAFTLMARLTDDAAMARVFAAFEALLTLGLAGGALVASVLVDGLGIRGALVAVGLLAPAAVLVSWRRLHALDRRMRVRDGDVALLQRIPMLRALPEVTIEQLAASLTYTSVPAGQCVFEQGDAGDAFYVIEEGRASVVVAGGASRELGAGDGFGEIALMRDLPRTATVRATTQLTVCGLSRATFVTAVAGYSASAHAADGVISGHMERFRPPQLA